MAKRRDWDKAGKKDKVFSYRTEPTPVVSWWLTISRFGFSCSQCGNRQPKQSKMAYNHADREALCMSCMENRGISPQPSKRLLTS